MDIVSTYLDLLDRQREAAFDALEGLSESQIWQRPAPKEWSIGEIIDHNYLLINSFLPLVRWTWNTFGWWGWMRRRRPYAIEIDDVYHRKSFPMWVGFLWTPRHNPRKPVPLEMLKAETRELHAQIRAFYTGKDESVLGNLHLYDPIFGLINLIVTLRIGIYHDQLHFEDVFKLARTLKNTSAKNA
jgi:hypothetical protein